jgi:xylitol oxidase
VVVHWATVRAGIDVDRDLNLDRGVGMTPQTGLPVERNWAGNHTYAGVVQRPTTIDEAAALVRGAASVRAVGSRHSFTDIVDAEVLVDMSGLDCPAVFDADARTITVAGAATYADVAQVLRPHGAALRNLASLPHISVAGAIATGTHGSGSQLGNLATSVCGLELIGAAGQIITVNRRTPDFDGMVVSMGALGLVAAVTLDVEFDYEIEQHVYGDVPLGLATEQLGMVLGAAYSVSIFTTFAGDLDGQVAQVWLKRRTDSSDRSMAPGPTFLDAPAATMQHHPVPGLDGSMCTPQLGASGLWADRLPHFRMGFTPSSGNEVQSEFFVGAADGPAALDALRRAAPDFVDRLIVGEVRSVAADELWMSPHYQRDSVAFHFTWHAGDNEQAVREVEAVLAPFAPRPHWGKVFHADSFSASESYEMFDDFVDMAVRLDPHGVFRNEWWRRIFGYSR